MRINFKIIQRDLTEQIVIPHAPKMIYKEAQNILYLLESTPVPDYTKNSQFDKWLIFEYWKRYDSPDSQIPFNDINWIMNKATNPENIRRSRQWLVQKNYLIPNGKAEERAMAAANNWTKRLKNAF